LDALAIREIVFEVLLSVIDECRFGETLVGQREGRIFGKGCLAGTASKANAPGIDAANQIAFSNTELSGRDIVSGKVAEFFLQAGHVSR
jgi:hypothetical protein